jgi:Holliday junction resolvase
MILPLPKYHASEKDITREIRGYLRIKGVWHFKVHQGLGSAPGVADIIGCHKGRMLCIEVKTDKGRLSPHQEVFLEKVKQEGGLAFVARSVEDVIQNLK